MTYITPPNSLVTGTTITADPIYSNFVAFSEGLSDGTQDLNVNALTTAATLTVGADLTTSGEYRCDGVDKGGKYWVPLGEVYTAVLGGIGNGYLGQYDGASTYGSKEILSAVTNGIWMVETGNVRALAVSYYPGAYVGTGTFGVQLHVNGSSIGSVQVSRSTTTSWYQVASFSRGVASYASGSRLAAYVNSNAVGTQAAGTKEFLRVHAEVQFDV